METPLRAAVIQFCGGQDVDRNLAAADRLVRQAAEQGAKLVLLPEKWRLIGSPSQIAAGAEPTNGEAVRWICTIANELKIDLIAGSLALKTVSGEVINTSIHAGPDGDLRASYGKMHLFDADVDGVAYRESDVESAGLGAISSSLYSGLGVGLSVCYDLRFPELYRYLAASGAAILTVPAAFTKRTTEDHWQILLRARAIENGCFVLAANQFGSYASGVECGGQSMIIDPWGRVLAQASSDGDAVLVADLDLEEQASARQRLPVMQQRRSDVAAALASQPEGQRSSHWRKVSSAQILEELRSSEWAI